MNHTLIRHPDDLKPFHGYMKEEDTAHDNIPNCHDKEIYWYNYEDETENKLILDNLRHHSQATLRLCTRKRKPNRRCQEYVTSY